MCYKQENIKLNNQIDTLTLCTFSNYIVCFKQESINISNIKIKQEKIKSSIQIDTLNNV